MKKLGVLGAGFMGAGIAYVSALAGIDVVLLDRDMPSAEKGKAHSDALSAKAVQRGSMSAEDKDALLARIKPTADYSDLAGCDLVIEAVFEERGVKAEATKNAAAVSFRRRDLRLQHLDAADHLARRDLQRRRRNSSASISSRRSTA